jgi:hypothetical protein
MGVTQAVQRPAKPIRCNEDLGQDAIDNSLVLIVYPALGEFSIADGIAQKALELNRPTIVLKLLNGDDYAKNFAHEHIAYR